MNLSLSPLAISYLLHLVATVIWLGGMALFVLVLYPLERQNPTVSALTDPLEKRFRPMANLSLLVLLVTGVFQMGDDEHYGGFFDFSTDWSRAILLKHIAFGGMVIIVAFLQFGLAPALERARLLAKKGDSQETVDSLRRRERLLTGVNFGLGMIVLVFTAIATAL